MKTIGIIGIGKLGLCFALNLERKGFEVIGVDVSQEYVQSLKNKTFVSDEPGVNEMLASSKNFHPTTEYSMLSTAQTIFVLVATPSLPDGSYDHSYIEAAIEKLQKESVEQFALRRLVIGCTTMPGYCDDLQSRVAGFSISYNPEFIAQGTVVKDQLNPDMILIGSYLKDDAQEIASIYEQLVDNKPRYAIMSPKEAEITKIALNCFLTTKIAYANMVGDVATASGVRPEVILSAIGADSRIGHKYLNYGYGFGGPCFPRDNRAFAIHADTVGVDALISKATDRSNENHLGFQCNQMAEKGEEFSFDTVTYKPESTLLVESQQLALAVQLADRGKKVHIYERKQVIEQLKTIYGEKFTYTEKDS